MGIKNDILVSFCLLSYNQEEYIEKAIEGVLSQTYSKLEIIISDDCSTDQTFAIIERLAKQYQGPHEIILNKNETNLGLVPHFNKVMEMTRGEYIAVAAGDDISLPERTQVCMDYFFKYPSLKAISSNVLNIDENGRKLQATDHIFSVKKLETYISSIFHLHASRIFHRSVFDNFGAFNENCMTEDSTSLLRCVMMGEVAQIEEVLVCHRKHSASLSSYVNFYRFNFLLIHEQYLLDIQTAYEKGIISEDEKNRLTLKLEEKLHTQNMLKSFHLAKSGYAIIKCFFPLVFSRDLSFRKKLSELNKKFRR